MLVCFFPLNPVQGNLAGELQYLWGWRCVYVCGQHPHRNWERKAAGIVNWASPPWRVAVIRPLAGGSVFLFTFSWWWKLATAVFRAASVKEVLQCWHKEKPEWMNYKSFGHLCVSVYSLSACLAHLANPATVRPRTAAACLDCPVFFCWIQRVSHGQIPSPHFHGVKLNDSLALCLVSRSQQEMAAPLRPIWREKVLSARTSLPKHFLFHR